MHHRVQQLLELDTDCVLQLVRWAAQELGTDLQLLQGQGTRLLGQDMGWMLQAAHLQEASQYLQQEMLGRGWLLVLHLLHHPVAQQM